MEICHLDDMEEPRKNFETICFTSDFKVKPEHMEILNWFLDTNTDKERIKIAEELYSNY